MSRKVHMTKRQCSAVWAEENEPSVKPRRGWPTFDDRRFAEDGVRGAHRMWCAVPFGVEKSDGWNVPGAQGAPGRGALGLPLPHPGDALDDARCERGADEDDRAAFQHAGIDLLV